MTVTIAYAQENDLPAIRKMAIELMPEMTELHGPVWDHRLGSGRFTVESLLIVARDPDLPAPIGFAWADAALLNDEGVLEPWWCLNAIAVRPTHRGTRIGRKLVEAVRELAGKAGIVSLHGICDRNLRQWYESQGFTVLKPGEKAGSDGIVRRFPPAEGKFSIGDGEGECVFFVDVESVEPRRITRLTPIRQTIVMTGDASLREDDN